MTDKERYDKFIKSNPISNDSVFINEARKQRVAAWSAQQKEIDRLRETLAKAFTADKWHGPEEVPKEGRYFVSINSKGMPLTFGGLGRDAWENHCIFWDITAWAYADELPKPEGIC